MQELTPTKYEHDIITSHVIKFVKVIDYFKKITDDYFYIYGGYIRDIIAGLPYNDIDTCISTNNARESIKNHLKLKCDIIYESSWVIRYKEKFGISPYVYDVGKIFKTPIEYFGNTDFLNNAIIIDSNYDCIYADGSIQANVNRELVTKSVSKNNAMLLAFRAGKLIQKGFHYKSENPSELIMDIEERFYLKTPIYFKKFSILT